MTLRIAPVVALTFAVRLAGVALTAGADLWSYTAGYGSVGEESGDLRQRDVQVRLGMGIPLAWPGGTGGTSPERMP